MLNLRMFFSIVSFYNQATDNEFLSSKNGFQASTEIAPLLTCKLISALASIDFSRHILLTFVLQAGLARLLSITYSNWFLLIDRLIDRLIVCSDAATAGSTGLTCPTPHSAGSWELLRSYEKIWMVECVQSDE